MALRYRPNKETSPVRNSASKPRHKSTDVLQPVAFYSRSNPMSFIMGR